jgi:predicted AlkP superfamily phosphohydrolase/phosphomutase
MNDIRRRRKIRIAILAAAVVLIVPLSVFAYVGPGAGIALATTAFALLSTVFVVMFGIFFWPARWAWRQVKMDRPPQPPRIKRAVIIGLDGIDPRRVRRLIEEGRVPNMAKLAEQGTLSELGTTWPAMSPVAWSSFSTGVNPGKHGIYDFLTRDPKSYLPDLSSADVRAPSRHINVGKWQIPIGKPRVRLLKKSKSFWNVLSQYGIPSSVLRVPITFPPDRFDGTMLSAMCVPDLKGSQGTFTHVVEPRATEEVEELEEGESADPYAVGSTLTAEKIGENKFRAHLVGPPNPIDSSGKAVETTIDIEVDRDAEKATLTVGDEKIELGLDEFTDWTEIAFKVGLGVKLRGICRMRLLSVDPMRLYVSPINIDPERPLLPISHPRFFATFLSKLLGRYATLGFAEDTWALNEGVLDDDAFLEQAWLNHAEREGMLFEVLRRTKKGLVTCVFDGTDRIQHMFYRYSDDDHPALRGKSDLERHRDVIDETYERCDETLGRVFEEVDITDPENLVIVMSDHGFESFRRGVNVNAWLHENGYLALKEDENVGPWFRGVDWANTKAFAVGLGGIFLNIAGREAQGIVPSAEAEELAREIAEKLEGIVDPVTGDVAIQKMYVAHDIYEGPYLDQAPSLIVGYSAGYRASWDGARGVCAGDIFDDNVKPWSGDHCIDPTLVPGVILSNQDLSAMRETGPEIIDVAPTVLDMFGIPTPRYMDGESLAPQDKPATKPDEVAA